jgi:hypothetical protein
MIVMQPALRAARRTGGLFGRRFSSEASTASGSQWVEV